jgi:glyoxylase I family protein
MTGVKIKTIAHASVLVRDTETALKFYRDVLCLSVDILRPALGYPGAWLQVGAQQLHLLELPNPDPQEGRPEHGGRDRHIAFVIEDVQVLADQLDAFHIPYTRSKSGRKALFCRDPDANALEFVEERPRTEC